METILAWFSDILKWLGILYKEGSLVFVGLDNAGKTTLLGILSTGHLRQAAPTQYPTCEELVINKIKLSCHDVGGHLEARRIWRDYFPSVNAIVFLVDATDQERLEEAKLELNGILTNPMVSDRPLLILGNKIDKRNVLSEEQLRVALCLTETTGKNTTLKEIEKLNRRPVELFMCSVVERTGFKEGFLWLSQYI